MRTVQRSFGNLLSYGSDLLAIFIIMIGDLLACSSDLLAYNSDFLIFLIGWVFTGNKMRVCIGWVSFLKVYSILIMI